MHARIALFIRIVVSRFCVLDPACLCVLPLPPSACTTALPLPQHSTAAIASPVRVRLHCAIRFLILFCAVPPVARSTDAAAAAASILRRFGLHLLASAAHHTHTRVTAQTASLSSSLISKRKQRSSATALCTLVGTRRTHRPRRRRSAE